MGTTEKRVRVLCVDDEPSLGHTATILERESEATTVETESDPETAIERVRRGTYDCVVCEYELPGSNGIELLEAVREIDPDQPVILFTGSGSEAVASEAIASDVTDYVRKGDPEADERLRARVERASARYREKREHERPYAHLETFADTAVHDLRGPLTAASGYLDLAREDGEDGPFLAEVDAAHDRMAQILDDLSALARVDDVAGERELVSIATAAEAGWPRPPGAQSSLEVRVPAELCALADRDRFVEFFERVFEAVLEDEPGRAVDVTVGALDDGFFVESEDDDRSSAPFDAAVTSDRGGHENWNAPGRRVVGALADVHGWQLSAIDGGSRLEITGVNAV